VRAAHSSYSTCPTILGKDAWVASAGRRRFCLRQGSWNGEPSWRDKSRIWFRPSLIACYKLDPGRLSAEVGLGVLGAGEILRPCPLFCSSVPFSSRNLVWSKCARFLITWATQATKQKAARPTDPSAGELLNRLYAKHLHQQNTFSSKELREVARGHQPDIQRLLKANAQWISPSQTANLLLPDQGNGPNSPTPSNQSQNGDPMGSGHKTQEKVRKPHRLKPGRSQAGQSLQPILTRLTNSPVGPGDGQNQPLNMPVEQMRQEDGKPWSRWIKRVFKWAESAGWRLFLLGSTSTGWSVSQLELLFSALTNPCNQSSSSLISINPGPSSPSSGSESVKGLMPPGSSAAQCLPPVHPVIPSCSSQQGYQKPSGKLLRLSSVSISPWAYSSQSSHVSESWLSFTGTWWEEQVRIGLNLIPINRIPIDLTNIEALLVDSSDSSDSSDSPIDSEAQHLSEWEGFATSSENKAYGDQSDSESDSADEAISSPPTGFLYEPSAEPQNEPEARTELKTTFNITLKSRPSLLTRPEAAPRKRTTQSRKRGAPGTTTKELVAEDGIVPEPPVKRTRSGRAAKLTTKGKALWKGDSRGLRATILLLRY